MTPVKLQELADALFNHPETVDPMVLDIVKDGERIVGKVDEGHRRLRAHWLNVKAGRYTEDVYVEFYYNKAEVTELDRMVRQMTSNMNFKEELRPYEQATVAWNVKNLYSEKPLSHEQVAKLLRVSRQTVDNLIKISSADDRMKQEMITADMNLKDCLELVSSKKKLDKQTNDAEMEGNKTSAAKTPLPHDPNAEELAELKEMEKQVANNDEDDLPFVEETAEQEAVREQAEAEKAMEQLLLIADEVKVKKLKNHLDKKLAAAVKATIAEDFVDESTGETKPVEKTTLYLNKGTVISEDIISQLVENKVDTVFLFKPGCEPVAPSVITEPVAIKEKDRYDSNRPEIAHIQNIIKLSDKLEFQVSKLDIPDGAKKDIADIVKWMQKDAQELREWVHTNKKQNKIR
jgi:DNA-binding XRE family transcriptional regulator